MPRKPRNFQIGHSYHITTRCNNREFKLSRRECREVFLYAIKKVSTKYNFRLYALCIMSNHVHYLIEPLQPEDLPKIMHYLNWYTAMCFKPGFFFPVRPALLAPRRVPDNKRRVPAGGCQASAR